MQDKPSTDSDRCEVAHPEVFGRVIVATNAAHTSEHHWVLATVRLSLQVTPDQAKVPAPVEERTRAPGSGPRHTAVAHDVIVYGYVEAPAEVRRKLRRGTVRAIRPPMARVARVLYAYALPVVVPVACVPGYVRIVHALGHPAAPGHDVVRRGVGPWVLEPVYGTGVGALRYVNDNEVYHCDPSAGLGVVAAVGRRPDCSPVVGTALSCVELGHPTSWGASRKLSPVEMAAEAPLLRVSKTSWA